MLQLHDVVAKCPGLWYLANMLGDEQSQIVILGGGLTGISAALHLRRRWLLVEKEDRLGGLARSDQVRGFTFDKTGHWLHLRDAGARKLVEEALPGGMVGVERRARVFSNGLLTRYPFQANLHGLPRQVAQECLLGFIESWMRRQQGRGAKEVANFEEFILDRMGAGIAKHFMVPYNHKLWGVHPREITAAWCARFVPVPTLEEVVGGALGPNPDEMGYNVRFLYPREGGIETLTRALAARLSDHPRGRVLTRTTAETIDWRARRVMLGGEWFDYAALVATLPLPEIVAHLREPPQAIAEAGARLRWTGVRYLNVATRTRPASDYHWIYVPEERYPFYRVGVFSNAMPSMAPSDGGSFYVELSERQSEASLDRVLPDVVQGLVAAKAIGSPEDILFAELRELPYAYVVFDVAYYAAVDLLGRWLESQAIFARGRYGSWIYNAMEDCLLAGREVAEKLDRMDEPPACAAG